MPYRTCLVVAFAILPASAPAADLTPRERGDLAIEARAILKTYCAECHNEKPPLVSVLNHRDLTAKGRPVPLVSLEASRSQVIEFIEDGSMPPGGRDRPTAEELSLLRRWVAAKAPAYPRSFDDRTTLAAMLDDWSAQKRADQPYLRYLSATHLVRDGQSLPNLVAVEANVAKALTVGSGKSIVPEPVNDTATLFRIDLRRLGWATKDLFDEIDAKGKAAGVFAMVPYDLLLLEYPFAVQVPENDKSLAAGARRFYTATEQLCNVPFLQADWLAAVLAEKMPLAEDMKSLVDLAAAKEAESRCGPPVRPFSAGSSIAGASVPLTARYSLDAGPSPASFKLTAEVVGTSKMANSVKIGEPFRIRVTSDRPARFVLLTVIGSGLTRVQPIADTVLKADEPRTLTPATAGGFVIASIPTGLDTVTEHFVLIAAENEVPVPTIVRSRHTISLDCEKAGRGPVWRFVFDKPGDFDPTKAIRKVIELKVTR